MNANLRRFFARTAALAITHTQVVAWSLFPTRHVHVLTMNRDVLRAVVLLSVPRNTRASSYLESTDHHIRTPLSGKLSPKATNLFVETAVSEVYTCQWCQSISGADFDVLLG